MAAAEGACFDGDQVGGIVGLQAISCYVSAMTTQTDRVDEKVRRAVDDVLKRRMGRWGFTNARISPGLDHDGDPVLFVDAEYRLVREPLDPRATFGLVTELRAALQALGENRFPHISHHFDERQTTAKFR
jgi:hypothetical protein